MEYFYEDGMLVKEPLGWNKLDGPLSQFDDMLSTAWSDAVKKGLFKYTLDNCKYKVLTSEDGSMKFAAQLNPQRFFKKRKRDAFETMSTPFDDRKFNFTKIAEQEILFKVYADKNTLPSVYGLDGENGYCNIIINVCPIDKNHILLVPEPSKCLPQKPTLFSLLMMVDMIKLNSHPGFRISFNSLQAWASVNHLHYHAMCCEYPLYIDTHPASLLIKSNCYSLDNPPIPGFLFKIPTEKRLQVVKEVLLISDKFYSLEIPFNFLITRRGEEVRLALFPRKSMKDMQWSPLFDLACVEIGGQFPVKVESEFEKLTFDGAVKQMQEEGLNEAEFKKIVEVVQSIL